MWIDLPNARLYQTILSFDLLIKLQQIPGWSTHSKSGRFLWCVVRRTCPCCARTDNIRMDLRSATIMVRR